MNLGALINYYRKINNISMEEFAEKSGLSKGYVSILEKGQDPRSQKPLSPSLSTYNKIANGMNIDLELLLSQIKGSSLIELNVNSNGRQRLLSYYDQLSEEGKKLLLHRAEELVKLDNI